MSEKTIDSYSNWVKLIITLNSSLFLGIMFKVPKTDIFNSYTLQLAVAFSILSIILFLVFLSTIIEHKNKDSSQENEPSAVGLTATISLFFAFSTFLAATVMTYIGLVLPVS